MVSYRHIYFLIKRKIIPEHQQNKQKVFQSFLVIQAPVLMTGLLLCSLALVTRLQDRSVDRGEVVALVTVDVLADFV